jgi:hypothetical protein
MILSTTGFLLGTGGSALVSKTLGEQNKQKANELFSMFIYLSIIIAVILSILGIVFVNKIGALMGGEGQMLKDATLYAKVAFQDEENEAEGLTFEKYQEHIKELEDAKPAFERGDDNSEGRYSQALVDIAKFEKRIKANKKEIIGYKEAILNVTATEKEFTKAFNKATEGIEKNT